MAATEATATRDDLLARLDAVEARLSRLVATPTPGLTEPDAATGERWEAGQVWAHIAEFATYWLEELERVVAGRGDAGPVPFGRTKTDAGRIAAVERDRRDDPAGLLERARADIARARELMRSLPAEGWAAVGRHPTRGTMSVPAILDDFVVGHLEEHADQLDGLARQAT